MESESERVNYCQMLITKDKDEALFIMWSDRKNKVPCYNCRLFKLDAKEGYQCTVKDAHDQCRRTYEAWLEEQI